MKKPLLQDDAFLADVNRSKDELSTTARLWWVGQSGFLLQYRGRHLLFDPYLSDSLTAKYATTDKPHVRISERVVAPEKLDFVNVITSTHNHTDHLDAQTLVPIIRAVQHRSDQRFGFSFSMSEGLVPTLVLPAANELFATERLAGVSPNFAPLCAWESREERPFQITAIPAAHDRLTMDEQGRNAYLGFVVKAGSTTLYHSGDTIVYDGLAESLKPFNIDLALLPINGKLGNLSGREAAQLAKDIHAKLVIPCHYDMFAFNTADPADEFIPECERLGQPYRVLQLGERFTSTQLP